MKRVLPIAALAALAVALPHGLLETLTIIALVILGARVLWQLWQESNTWENRLARQLRKAGIKAKVGKLPDGKTLADVLKELGEGE